MTSQDLKHALISLVIGVLTMALTQIVTGALHLVTEWLGTIAGGTVASTAYLHAKGFV